MSQLGRTSGHPLAAGRHRRHLYQFGLSCGELALDIGDGSLSSTERRRLAEAVVSAVDGWEPGLITTTAETFSACTPLE